MADDQKPKTMDINDLVRELSKSSTSPTTPSPIPPPIPQPPKSFSPTPKPPILQPLTGSPTAPSIPKPPEMPKPKFNVPPQPFNQLMPLSGRQVNPSPAGQVKPAPVPAPTVPPSPPGVKEYQSSIRTMNEDMSRLKQGQKPTGIDIPRKVEQVTPIPQPTPPKPAIPVPQFKVPSVNLGETKKTAPLAQSRNIPTIPSTPKAESKTQIYVPQEGQPGDNRNILFIGIGAVVLVAGFAYWFFVLRSPAPEVVIESPTPTPIATPTPDLGSIWTGLESQTVLVLPESTVEDFIAGFNSGFILGGQFKKIYLSENDTSGNLTRVLGDLNITYPVQLKESLGTDSLVLIYGQKEIFDSKGQIKIDAIVEKRLVFVSEVKDAVAANQLGKTWETEMANNLKTILQLDPKKQESPDFMDNSYRGVRIRYKNFPYADRSIDYAVITASNRKNYFVVANSREAMFSTIDQLKGF